MRTKNMAMCHCMAVIQGQIQIEDLRRGIRPYDQAFQPLSFP